VGVLAGAFAGFAAFALSVVFDSQAVMANDNSAIARIFFMFPPFRFTLNGREFLCSPVNGVGRQNVSSESLKMVL
jgi:hypothetical protein